MDLTVVRHGETSLNHEARYLGVLDPPLSEAGTAQAVSLRDLLTQRFDTAITSPRLRARQTAELLCAKRSIPIEVMPEFRERHVGVFEGLTQVEARSQFPDLWSQNVTRQWTQAPPGGETIAEVVIRVHTGLAILLKRYQHSAVLLVAHGFVAKVIRALSGAGFHDFFEWQLANGSFISLSLAPRALMPSPTHSPFPAR